MLPSAIEMHCFAATWRGRVFILQSVETMDVSLGEKLSFVIINHEMYTEGGGERGVRPECWSCTPPKKYISKGDKSVITSNVVTHVAMATCLL